MDGRSKIRLLSEDLIGKIAAGEIIERPASVVKELVENAIDAGSTRIEVEIRDGGKELIRVTDDGVGMTADDAKMAFSRHATSKLRQEEDLFRIMTLGFRGEALPSIGTVARVELATRRWDEDAGVAVKFDAGNLVEISPVGTPPGTTVTVRHLFYNVPARLKFLKSTQTESRSCVSIVSSLALAHPEIAFQMLRDGNKVFVTAGSGRLIDAIMGVYGASIAKDLVELHFGRDDIRVRGYVSRPEAARKSRNYQVFFVNGRYFQSGLIRSALEKGFEGYIPRGRFPVGILDIKLDPSDVDVNVHPSKLEIKFKDEQAMFQSVMLPCKRTLSGLSPFAIEEEPSNYTDSLEQERIQASFDLFKVLSGQPRSMPEGTRFARSGVRVEERLPDNRHLDKPISSNFEDSPKEPEDPKQSSPDLLAYSVVGQVHSTYIVVEVRDGMLIIDQHAAHERIIYEELSKTESVVESQVLLVPETVDLDRDAFQLMEQHVDLFTQAGFEVEVFGGSTFIVRAVPVHLKDYNPETMVRDILDELSEARGSMDEFKKHLNMVISCKSAVKAGDTLSMEEMRGLVSTLFSLSDIYTCPHGRPAAVKITTSDLEKRFFRVL